MGVPCALHSAAVCSFGRATQRRREPGSCHWFVPGRPAPSDARRGWGRCTSPEKAGPRRDEGYHGGVSASHRSPPSLHSALGVLSLSPGPWLGSLYGLLLLYQVIYTQSLKTMQLPYPAALQSKVELSGLNHLLQGAEEGLTL